MPGPEARIEKRFVQGIESLGGKCYKLTEDGKKGFPDRTIVLKSRVMFVELKTPVGRLSPQQKKKHKELVEAGGEVHVLWSFEDVTDFLDQLSSSLGG